MNRFGNRLPGPTVILQQIALVRQTDALPADELLEVSAALQKQVTRDFAPIWNVDATVDPFLSLDRVPVGYWRVLVVDDTLRPVPGVHETADGKPFALVTYREDWDTLASHEVLELLADPSLNRRVAGDSPHPRQGRVEFLVEVCDPCQAAEFGYPVNGRWMSDFYTPAYFDPVAADGVRYSFQGSLTAPRQVLRGGYLTWREPETGRWWMKRNEGSGEEIIPFPEGAVPSGGNLRGKVDRYVDAARDNRLVGRVTRRSRARRFLERSRAAMRAEATALRAELDALAAT
jgi:hypothetical protein